jgi:hypothetical protein
LSVKGESDVHAHIIRAQIARVKLNA